MKKRSYFYTVGLSLMIAISQPAFAAVVAQSTFDTGTEGWEWGEFLSTTGNSPPDFLSAGGNPGGFIRVFDIFIFNAFQAPAGFLGNQSATYGGSIHLEERVQSSDGIPQAMVMLSDGSLLLQFRTSPPGTTFTAYDIPLLASAGWEVAFNGIFAGPAASEAQLLQVLSNLTLFNIDADWDFQNDRVDLDNVRLSSPTIDGRVPDAGGTLTLLGTALLGIFGWLHCQHRRAALS